MTLRLFAVLWAAALMAFATKVSAHRLDEYLQATTIAVDRGQVNLQLSLTPGVSVAQAVLARIDANGDGSLSPAEQRHYAERARANLRLRIDGALVTPELRSWTFATPAALQDGVGDISLLLTAPVHPGGHRITLDHPHPDDQAVYLVNTLLPTDPGIQVVGQERSVDQSHYQLDLTIDAAAPAIPPVGLSHLSTPPSRSDALPILITFFERGVHHILTGYDHLLFVVALVLGATTLWDLVKVVTAFTVAHSITLTLAALQLVHLPDALVEPVIAASIVAVAVQNVARPRQARSGSRLMLAFLFGLFHGLGFAGGLLEVMHDLSGSVVLLAILGFSVGVEVGNQMVLLPLFAGLRAFSWGAGDQRRSSILRIRQLGSLVVAAAGMVYFVEAVAAV